MRRPLISHYLSSCNHFHSMRDVTFHVNVVELYEIPARGHVAVTS
ncbi:MAG: hypothetical protein PV344_05645 [Anaplasma sp.]|nr:hypothetical protein [Anaplasma sp.]